MPVGTHSQFIRHTLHLAELAGADPMAIERELGAELREAGENGWVSTEFCYRKIRLLKQLLNTDSPPFLLAKNFSMSAYGVAGYVILNSPNGETAFRKYAEYQDLTSDLCRHEIIRTPEGLMLQQHFKYDWCDELRFVIEFTWLGFLHQVSAAVGRVVYPLRATFTFPEPPEVYRYHEAFPETELIFSHEVNSLLYPAWVAEGKLITANPAIFATFDEMAQEALRMNKQTASYSSKVRSILVNEIRGTMPGIGEIAEKLNLSPRTLQIKLKEEETTFREIADEVRRDLAMVHLRKRMLNFSEIAYLLGFSEVSAFSNAFKKWTGQAPSAYSVHS